MFVCFYVCLCVLDTHLCFFAFVCLCVYLCVCMFDCVIQCAFVCEFVRLSVFNGFCVCMCVFSFVFVYVRDSEPLFANMCYSLYGILWYASFRE